MRRKLSDDLKTAIAQLSTAQKDKLLFRLIAKDEKLVEKLIFELLEEGKTSEKRSEDIRLKIQNGLPQKGAAYTTPGMLLMDLRALNPLITAFAATTKDKANEVSLTAYMVAEVVIRHEKLIRSFPDNRSDTLAPYIVRRMKGILPKIKKLDEDYYIDFEKEMDIIFNFIWSFNPTTQAATEEGLPKKWRD